ncbi:uncharacterized protein VTP21DRAFT_6391 [Calcarisporiella thermophila]|uniref:uncharacterized protein n=1 Tax=Calcarisporiella thermophila TaxID=911321 RepID=UPI003742C0BE
MARPGSDTEEVKSLFYTFIELLLSFKVINTAFHRNWNTRLFAECFYDLQGIIDTNPDNLDVLDAFTRLTLDGLGNALFGVHFRALKDQDNPLVITYRNLMNGNNPLFFILPMLDKLPYSKRHLVYHHLDEFDNMLFHLIFERRRELEKSMEIDRRKADLLTLMLLANNEEENSQMKLSEREVRDNLILFFIAGNDTTASALVTIVYYLALHPEYQDKSRAEVFSAISDEIPTFEEQAQLAYLANIIREALRLVPPVVMLGERKAVRNYQLGEYMIPRGSTVQVHIWGMHRDAAVWGEDVDVFRPERWEEGDRKQLESHFWPFSIGARNCVGLGMSMVEMKVIISMLLRQYRWELAADSAGRDGLPSLMGTFITHIMGIRIKFKRI